MLQAMQDNEAGKVRLTGDEQLTWSSNIHSTDIFCHYELSVNLPGKSPSKSLF